MYEYISKYRLEVINIETNQFTHTENVSKSRFSQVGSRNLKYMVQTFRVWYRASRVELPEAYSSTK